MTARTLRPRGQAQFQQGGTGQGPSCLCQWQPPFSCQCQQQQGQGNPQEEAHQVREGEVDQGSNKEEEVLNRAGSGPAPASQAIHKISLFRAQGQELITVESNPLFQVQPYRKWEGMVEQIENNFLEKAPAAVEAGSSSSSSSSSSNSSSDSDSEGEASAEAPVPAGSSGELVPLGDEPAAAGEAVEEQQREGPLPFRR